VKDSVISIEPILNRFKLTGKVALVTGAAQGIGRAYAHALAEAGARVAILDLNLEKAETVAHEIILKKGEAIAVRADVSDEDSIDKAFNAVVQKWGSLTIGVNNAGISIWNNSETQEKKDWDKVLNLNLTGVYLCCRKEAQLMDANGYGKIINTASMSAHIVNTPQNQAAYNTSKAGVLHLSKSLATEWALKGIRVNTISPGYTKTKLVSDLLETEIGKEMSPIWMERTPVHKMLDVTDLQGGVVYLASPASDFMTGADLLIDGGYCAW
jgi:NAD(P)-dependent dehydrogenase (short-subunit alcohol dehydrogenase family)